MKPVDITDCGLESANAPHVDTFSQCFLLEPGRRAKLLKRPRQRDTERERERQSLVEVASAVPGKLTSMGQPTSKTLLSRPLQLPAPHASAIRCPKTAIRTGRRVLGAVIHSPFHHQLASVLDYSPYNSIVYSVLVAIYHSSLQAQLSSENRTSYEGQEQTFRLVTR